MDENHHFQQPTNQTNSPSFSHLSTRLLDETVGIGLSMMMKEKKRDGTGIIGVDLT